MTRRYFVSEIPADGGTVVLDSAETQHAVHVMRVQQGDHVELFDGKGHQANAVVSLVGRNECRCETQQPIAVDREPDRAVHLAVALPKADRARELVERLTELGVKRLTPLIASRTQREPSKSMLAKLRRVTIEACKQCGRNQLLDVLSPASAAEFFRSTPQSSRRLIAHPTGDPLISDQSGTPVDSCVAIGPEGGWTNNELNLAVECGFVPVSLGRRTYRIETAATVVAVLLA